MSCVDDEQMSSNMREKNQLLVMIEIADALSQLQVEAADKINANLELGF